MNHSKILCIILLLISIIFVFGSISNESKTEKYQTIGMFMAQLSVWIMIFDKESFIQTHV